MRKSGYTGVPAHRVIGAGGRLGGYGGNEHLKRMLLVAEGVEMQRSRIPLQRFRWKRALR